MVERIELVKIVVNVLGVDVKCVAFGHYAGGGWVIGPPSAFTVACAAKGLER